VVKTALENEAIGEVKGVIFHHSAYKYHGLATLKTWLSCNKITSAHRKRIKPDITCRYIKFSNKNRGRIYEPRDYSKGSFVIEGSQGSISDSSSGTKGNLILEPILDHAMCKGFRIADITSSMDQDETDLMGRIDRDARVTSLMDNMKRVGFFRLLKRIYAGGGGYPLEEALDDMVVDYYLDKLGFYVSSFLMSIKSGLGSFLLKSFTKAIGK
jgi:hypothetical protein